jgi:cytochrome b
VRVWDLPVRLFHWLLVLLVVISFTTGKLGGNWLSWHFKSGYCILALVLFRVAWGLFGSQTARLSDFIHGPMRVVEYASSLMRGASMFHTGHNPMGGLMVVLMLALLLVQATTGLFVDDDAGTTGPLSGKVSGAVVSLFTTVHRININILLVCVALHVCAALFYLLVRKDNLIKPMFTGTKMVPDGHPEPTLSGTLPALIVVALSAAFVAWLVLVYAR